MTKPQTSPPPEVHTPEWIVAKTPGVEGGVGGWG